MQQKMLGMLKNSGKKQIHADASDSEADEDDKF